MRVSDALNLPDPTEQQADLIETLCHPVAPACARRKAADERRRRRLDDIGSVSAVLFAIALFAIALFFFAMAVICAPDEKPAEPTYTAPVGQGDR